MNSSGLQYMQSSKEQIKSAKYYAHVFNYLIKEGKHLNKKVLDLCLHPEKPGWYWMWTYQDDGLFSEPRVFYVYRDGDWFAKTMYDYGTLTIRIADESILFCWMPIEFDESWRERD